MRNPAADKSILASGARGFTLIELVVTILIAAVLVTMAIPNFRTMLLNNTLTAESNDFLASLQTARSEAVKRNTQVVLCLTDNVTATTPTCGGAGATVNSWFSFQDTNANGVYDAGDVIIELHPQLQSGKYLYGDAAQAVVFAPTGFPAVGVAQMRNVLLCDSRGIVASSNSSSARAVLISTTGHGTVVNSVAQTTTAKTAIGAGAAC
jgi:type IV fimbrial biogenesis protein FimT